MLGKLKKVELRAGWKHEALDFTKWLAQDENLELLSNEVGFDIKLIQTEARVGSFNVDILAEEENTENKIIIENQLEISDHDHLGKIITYASGYNAKAIIWIVKDVREEHRNAIDWLNENTDEEIGFYLVRIELWQIADSPLAPKFEIISKPNNWARSVKSSTLGTELQGIRITQLEYWDNLKDYAKQNNTILRFQKSHPHHWLNVSIGSSACHIGLTINTRDSVLGCELYISDNKELYHKLFSQKELIEKEIGDPLEWMELPERKASRIKISLQADATNRDDWERQFEWIQKQAEKFKEVFPKYL